MEKQKWPNKLVIVRHGQSEFNVVLDLLEENVEETLARLKTIRDTDISLTDLGIQQAEQTGTYLADYQQFDICLSSPYKRTVQTAETIISQLPYNLKIFKDNRLREKEFGRLHALTTEDIKEKFPEEYEGRGLEGKYWYRLLGGENYPDVEMRVHSFLDKLVRDWGGKNVLVTTHHVPYVSFRTLFEHLNEEQVLTLGSVPNCGIQEYNLDTSKKSKGKMNLIKYNEKAY